MKQTLIVIACIAMLASCTKKDVDTPILRTGPANTVVTTADPGVTTTYGPTKRAELYSGYIDISSKDSTCYLLGQNITFTFTGINGTQPAGGIMNVVVRYEMPDGTLDSVTYVAPFVPTTGTVLPLRFSAPKKAAPGKYSVKIFAQGADTKTRGQITLTTSTVYGWVTNATGASSPNISTPSRPGNTAQFFLGSVVTMLAANQPETVVGVNQDGLLVDMRADFGSSTVQSIGVGVDPALVQSIAMYRGATLVASVAPNTATGIALFALNDFDLPKGEVKSFSFRPVFKPGVGTRTSVTMTLIGTDYTTEAGDKRRNDTALTNTFLYYRSQLYLRALEINEKIVDGKDITFFHGKVSVKGGYAAVHQIPFTFKMVDNKGNDTLRLDSLRVLFKGTDVTNTGVFINTAGNQITKLTEDDGKFFFKFTSGRGEMIVADGDEFMFVAVANGFKHASDGDGIGIAYAQDDTPPPAGYKTLNAGASGQHSKLYLNGTKNNAAISYGLLWSDLAAVSSATVQNVSSHNGIIGLSQADYTNGYKAADATIIVILQ